MGVIASVQQYDLNIPVGGSQAIDVAGDRVQFLSATDPFAVIEVRPNFAQGNITLKPGQGMRFAEQVQRWVVFNKGNVALTGMLMIGTGDFFDQRISGTVDVIDGGKARTLGNAAFMGGDYVGALAAKNSVSQLWNPAGSGKNLFIEAITFGTSTITGAGFNYSAVALPNASTNQPISKKMGGGVSTAQLKWDQAAAPAGSPMGSISLAASTSVPYKFSEPICVVPGTGLSVFATNQNNDIRTIFEFFEEAF